MMNEATPKSIKAASAKLIEQLRVNPNELAEATLDGHPSKNQLAEIQQNIIERLNLHAILRYVPLGDGNWDIGVISTTPAII